MDEQRHAIPELPPDGLAVAKRLTEETLRREIGKRGSDPLDTKARQIAGIAERTLTTILEARQAYRNALQRRENGTFAAIAFRNAVEQALDQIEQPQDVGSDEKVAFEEYAAIAGLNRDQHPLHYLFLDPATYAARQAWKAALAFAGYRKQGDDR